MYIYIYIYIYSIQRLRHSPNISRLTDIGIPIINIRRSGHRLRFIMGILIPIRRCLHSVQRHTRLQTICIAALVSSCWRQNQQIISRLLGSNEGQRSWMNTLQWRHNSGAMASQITSLTIVYSTIYSGADQRKHQGSASLAFVRGIHRPPVNSPHKWPVTLKMFPLDDVIMINFLPFRCLLCKECRQPWVSCGSSQSWWRHQMETFFALLALCAGNSPVPVNSPHKGQWRGALMLSLICARINDWVNNREAGDLRRHRGHYDVSVMMLQAGWVDLNMDVLGEHLLMMCNRYWRYDALDFCLKTIKFKSFLNKARLLEMRTGTLYGVKLLANSGANLHIQTTIVLISQRNESFLLNYALKLGRYDMVHYFLDQGIELSDASLSILLNSCSHRSNRFPINSTCVTSRQGLSDIHLRIQAVSRQLLSLRPQLINEKCDNILLTPIQEAITGGLLYQVVHLIQYGASLEGMEEFALSKIMENECVYCPARKWNCYAIFYVIIHASTVLRALPYTDTKSRHAELALVSLQKRLAGPYKLQEFCRATIVGQMRGRALSGVSELRLPLLLQNYLRYEDLITELPLICVCPKLKPTSDPCICQSVKAEWHRCI